MGTQNIAISGSGYYIAGDLESDWVDVRVPGSADITIWVKRTLTVTMKGSGTISYYGEPTVNQNGSGSGEINSLGEK